MPRNPGGGCRTHNTLGSGAGGTRTHGQGIMRVADIGAYGLYLHLCHRGTSSSNLLPATRQRFAPRTAPRRSARRRRHLLILPMSARDIVALANAPCQALATSSRCAGDVVRGHRAAFCPATTVAPARSSGRRSLPSGGRTWAWGGRSSDPLGDVVGLEASPVPGRKRLGEGSRAGDPDAA